MKKKRENFFFYNYKKCFSFFKESKNFILASFAIFILVSLFGFIFPIFFEDKIMEFMKTLIEQVKDYNVYQMISFIILNNLKASLLSIFLGIALGIFPLITLVSNAYILGFVANYTVGKEGIFVLWRLFPHGIFELPAIIISIGIGMKLGFDVFKKNPSKILKINLIESLRFFIFVIIPLLLIAGIIEGSLMFFLE